MLKSFLALVPQSDTIAALSMIWMEATDDCPCSAPHHPSGCRRSLIEFDPNHDD
jgi:hypothetical protein